MFNENKYPGKVVTLKWIKWKKKVKRYVHGDDGKMKHKEREEDENNKEEEKRIDAPLFIFSLVLFLLFFFAILFGSFVKFPSSFNSSKVHHYDVHSHALHHIHHKSNEGED